MRQLTQYLICAMALCFSALSSVAQIDSTDKPLLDSVNTVRSDVKQKIKAATGSSGIREFQDSSKIYQQQIDSVTHWMSARASGLQQEYSEQVNKVNKAQQRLRTKLDSLIRLSLPHNKVSNRLDSLNQRLVNLEQQLRSRLSDTKDQAVDKLAELNVPPELQQQVDKLKSTITKISPTQLTRDLSQSTPGTNNLTNNLALPTLTTPASITDAMKLPNGTDITNVSMPEMSTDLPIPSKDQITQLSNISELSGQSEKTLGILNTIKEQPIDKLAEGKVASLQEVQEIQKRAKLEGVDALKSEEALKTEMKRQAQAAATDHFRGKQAELKAAMEKISKYKQKYSEVKSMADLAKKPPNPLKEKSFYERLLPGTGLQILKKGDDILVDINPYVGYKFTTRITAGVGWNQRVAYNWDLKSFSHSSQIYGPRLYGEFNLSKGFSPRLELELMNTLVPPATVKVGDPSGRQWVPGAFAGMKKQYKISKQLRGTASVMFRLFDPKRQSPYGDVVNARFGFEYVFKKKRKQEKGDGK